MANRIIWRKKVSSLIVTCVRGAAWITWNGSQDHMLEPGRSMEIRDVRDFCLEILFGGEAILKERVPDGRRPPQPATGEVLPARSSSAA